MFYCARRVAPARYPLIRFRFGTHSVPQPHLFLPNRDRRTSCSMENADLEMDTRQANPYVAFESISGDIGIALLCRGGRFVGARLETALTNTSAAALLTRAAGVPVRSTCGPTRAGG